MLYSANNKVRIVTAASLFDGHDAAINIMRRIMQSKGAEIIHLGHNRSVYEIVETAIEEDVQGIAITSYQGGHVEFFKYMKDLLNENNCGHIKIFGGGGGTILPSEIRELENYGITKIYSPDDGRTMGLEGMIEDVIEKCKAVSLPPKSEILEYPTEDFSFVLSKVKDVRKIAQAITAAENGELSIINHQSSTSCILGITGTGGAGKSSVTDEIVRRFLNNFSDKTIAVISVDPSKKKTGGALLGDRIRMNAISNKRAYMRSLATRDSDVALSAYVEDAINICKAQNFDLIIVETAGVGQSDASILNYVDVSLYVMTPEYGAASQLEKINMLDYADVIAINKFDKAGALDALNDVRKQYKRNHNLFTAANEDLPIVGTVAAQFNDAGINQLFALLMIAIRAKKGIVFGNISNALESYQLQNHIIPSSRIRYLSEIVATNKTYDNWVEQQASIATSLYQLDGVQQLLKDDVLADIKSTTEAKLHPDCKQLISNWSSIVKKYQADFFEYEVRGKIIKQPLTTLSLSGTKIPKVVLPKYKDWGDILKWQLQENIPGEFPYTSGVFELKRQGEDPTRMFAGEGGPERTNKRFHYLSLNQPATRLSTAFDSVTLYGEDPALRPDIYGKIGNAGVSIATVDDAKKLYSGFDLCDAKTSVSMTINGPAPMLLAFFLNAAIDQQCEKWIEANNLWEEAKRVASFKFRVSGTPIYYNPSSPERLPEGNNGLGIKLLGLSGDEVVPHHIYQQLKQQTFAQVRGTVQADILKEDQAQNTCIFSTEFALKLMGDVQQYFIDNSVRNFYSV
ncbi:MAG: methylmalonyl-CoA mutase family protein, partial [Pedobacter sp.]|nr:methylmalonyl-CoA mutase family protein [Chitinophagaceae bacterium]